MTLRTRAPLLALVLLATPGCFFWPATVDPAYHPQSARRLDVAGIHGLAWAVEVVDERTTPDARVVGRRRGTLLYQPSVRIVRDVGDVVAEALSNELEARDLRVVDRDADVLLQVRVEEYYAIGSGGELIGPEGGEVRAYAEGVVRVIDARSGRQLLAQPVAARAVHRSMLLTARKYEWALSDVAGEFARRSARHPDVLIAVQTIAGLE